jgi:hypothetical protein
MFQKYWQWANQIVPFEKIKEKTTMRAHPFPIPPRPHPPKKS